MAELRQFNYSNFGRSTLLSGLGISDTEMFVQLLDAGKFPNADATYDEIFTIILSVPGLDEVEIVYVTGTGNNQFTVERGKESTVARTWPAGTNVVHNITAQEFTDIVDLGPRLTDLIIFMSSVAGEANGGAISANGIGWTKRQKPEVSVRNIVWLPVQKRAVLVNSDQPGSAIYTSDDYAVTWQPQVTPSGSAEIGWTGLAFSPTLGAAGRLVVSGSNSATTNGNKIMTSDDFGETWVLRSTPAGMDSQNWEACHWDAENLLFLVGATSGTDMCYLSTDGITWVAATTALVANGMYRNFAQQDAAPFRITHANRADINNWYSDDGGDNWTAINPNGWGGGTTSVAWGGPEGAKLFVAALGGAQGFETSPDAIIWTNRPLPAGWNGPNFYERVIWVESLGLFVALQSNVTSPNGVVTSPDGITWTGRDIGDGDETFIAGAVIQQPALRDQEELILVEDTNTATRVANSVDGYSWFSELADIASSLTAAAFSPTLGATGRFVIVGDGGNIQTSDDAGQTWTSRTSPAAINYTCAHWSAFHGLFLIGANGAGNENIVTSPDGINWTARTATNHRQNAFAEDASGNLIAAGLHNFDNPRNVQFSDDGITWVECTTNSGLNVNALAAYDPTRSRFLVVGNTEEAFVSTDLGDNWTDLSTNITAIGHAILSSVFQNMIRLSSTDRFVIPTTTGVITSDDGGVTWVERFNDGNLRNHVIEMSTGRLLSCSSAIPHMVISDDAGLTWYAASDPDDELGSWVGMAVGRVLEVG